MNILVTGGAGYIGSHTVGELLEGAHDVIVVDNLSNSSQESLNRIEKITGKRPIFYRYDIRDKAKLHTIFKDTAIDAVIHFAGLKAVGESVENPLLYYDNNLISTLMLCEVMDAYNVRQFVFSSSATVYGEQSTPKYKESMSMRPVNPYGRTKAMIEEILRDLVATNKGWRVTSLRYFNPVGAHHSGHIGEDPNGVPNNLFPYVAQVAVGKRESLSIFGNDYDTPDGTGVRDYIHVVDLAKGHVAALIQPPRPNTYAAYNLGSGTGNSVMEVIAAFEKAAKKPLPYKVVPRRAGDLPIYYADPSLAKKELSWQTKKSIDEACADSWRWQSQNPNGYSS